MREHPLRYALVNELHARPPLDLEGPAHASFYALVREEGSQADRDHLLAFCRRYGLTQPPPDAKHYSARADQVTLKWEQHTEFTSWLFVRRDGGVAPFTARASDTVAADWWQDTPGDLLVATHLVLLPRTAEDPGPAELAHWFNGESLCTSELYGERAAVWTDFRIHADGASRFLIRNQSLSPVQCGRLVQRLAELETYRAMSLLALPLAQAASPRIRAVDLELAALTARLKSLAGLEGQRAALHELTLLSGEIEDIAAGTAYRFGATVAYHALVLERIEPLREPHDPGRQSIAEFIERRLLPAVRTCESVAARQESLSQRLTRSADLLRTLVDVALEEQNRDLLASMNQRTRMQFRLQETVEGLSIAAITYYVVGLVGYAAKWAHGVWPALSVELAQALAIPLVAAVLWSSLRRLRRRLATDDPQH
ncbi:MAG: DUF3422 domain-containing protein [Gammaproteobacteria bacterium]|nr:DUF3422 domain-containing protein [Gammaproteobacteria bacterium]